MMARRVAMPKLVALRAAQGKRQRDFSLRRATLSQERKRKKKSPCSVRSRKIIRDANDANDGGGEGARGIEGRPDVWSGLPVNWGKRGRLPCGCGGGLGFDFGELRHDAELLHEAQSVP